MPTIIFGPDGQIAMIVHGATQDSLDRDPAFNPPGGTREQVANADYNQLKDHREIIDHIVTRAGGSGKQLPQGIHDELARLNAQKAFRERYLNESDADKLARLIGVRDRLVLRGRPVPQEITDEIARLEAIIVAP